MHNESEEQKGESKNSNVEEDRNEVRRDDDMTESSKDDSGVVKIGEDTSGEEEPIPTELLTDDEVPTKRKDKPP